MSEFEAMHYCSKCDAETEHLFSGSGTKGTCMQCGKDLPEGEKADLNKFICGSE